MKKKEYKYILIDENDGYNIVHDSERSLLQELENYDDNMEGLKVYRVENLKELEIECITIHEYEYKLKEK